MRKSFLYLLLMSSTAGFAQKVGKPDAYAKTITAADLKKHLYIVAGPEMQGRDAASEGERKAAQYIENEFRRIGLEPSANGTYRQPFNLYQDSLASARLEVNGQPFELNKDFTLSVGNALSTTFRFSEVVVIGNNAADSLQKADLAGKLVLILPGGNTGGGNTGGGNTSNPGNQTASTGKVESVVGPDGQPLRELTPDEVFAMSARMEIGTRRCYERALKDDPFLKVSKIKATITVTAAGVVTAANLSTMADTPLGICLATAIKRWKFRASTSGIVSEFSLVFEQR